MPIDWLDKFCRLRVDRASGDIAPHKPLLLLVVCDLAEEGLLRGNRLALTPQLASRFFSYWPIVAQRRRRAPDVRLPFHHLGSDGVWIPLDQDGNHSPARLTTRAAELPSDLVAVLSEASQRDQLRQLLIARYFQPSEQIALYEAIGLPVPPRIEIEQNAIYGNAAAAAKLVGREARFRIRVLAAYEYTCALTGHRLTTISGASIVDAAHIHQFADSRNNDIDNGIALSKNAHWLFDHGLWTLSDDYEVIEVIVASDAFEESAPHDAILLSMKQGARILLPKDTALRPNLAHLDWHRRKRFAQRLA
jgi:putative restriction endonuclease